MSKLERFFRSGNDVLSRDPAGHDFPATALEALKTSQPTNHDDFDRIVIYRDGFSHAIDPHRPPFWNAEQGRADTWSFAVIGECFNANGHHTVEVTGWLSHEVHYEEQSSHYLGAQMASHSKHFVVFALETALPAEAFAVEHIHGHSSEPFNDMVDWLARQERLKSFYCRRQQLDMQIWRRIFPHLWKLFSTNDGMPTLCTAGLRASAPAFPVAEVPSASLQPPSTSQDNRELRLQLSMATANVASMYNGD